MRATRNGHWVWGLVAVALLALAGTAGATVFENTTHEMAVGDFFGDGLNQLAYIRTDGRIFVQDFVVGRNRFITLPGGETALKLVAADVNGDGRDDLGIVTSSATGLRTYDFATSSFSPVAGSTIQDITSANIDADPRDEIMVTNAANSIFIFESGSFSAPGGAGSALASGEFNGDATEEFLITNGSDIYFYDGETASWNVFQGGGSGINRIAAGNLATSDAIDEVYLTNTGGSPFVTDAAGFVGTTGSGSEIGIGYLDADLGTQELAYIIGAGTIYQSRLAWGGGAFGTGYVFLPVDATSDPTAVLSNAGFTDFIVADIDGDGLDELLALRGGNDVYRFDNGDLEFVLAEPIPEPTTLTLLGLGGLGMLTRRRKRRTTKKRGSGWTRIALLAAVLGLVGSAAVDANPASIADLERWYKADAIGGLNNGDPVSQWDDSTANLDHATQGSPGLRPSYLASVGALAGNPAVRYGSGGALHWLGYDGTFLAGQPFSVFVLEGRRSNKNDNYFTGGSLNAGNSQLILGYRNNTTMTLAQYMNDLNATVPGFAGQQFVISTFQSDLASGKAIFRDGVLANSNTNTQSLVAYPGATLGARQIGLYEGDIAEVIIYDRALTTAEQHQVGAYLEKKYGLKTFYARSELGQEVLQDDPRIYHRLGEAPGATTAFDIAPKGGNQHGSYLGSPTLGVSGIPNHGPEGDTAVRFDGLDDQVQILDGFHPSAYTLEAWVKVDSGATTSRSLIVRTAGNPLTAWSHQLRINAAGQFEHYIFDQGAGASKAVAGSTVLQPDVWYYVAATAANGGLMRLFVNGFEEGTPVGVTGLWTGGNQWLLGSNSGSGMSFFDGVLDEMALYDYALTPDRILAHYTAGIPEPTTLTLLGLGGLGMLTRRR